MKVFLKNYNIGKLLPPEIEKIPVRKPGGEVPGGNAVLENQTQKIGRSAQKRTTRCSHTGHTRAVLFSCFPDFSKILFLETLTGYPDASDA